MVLYIGSPPRALRSPASLSGRPCRAADVWRTVHRAQEGDPEAFTELYLHYVDRIFRYFLTHLHDPGQAEDYTSETFLRAFRRIETLQDRGRDPAAWLVTIAHNILRDHHRSGRVRWEISAWDPPEPARGIDPEDPEPYVLRQLLGETLRRCIGELNVDQQRCIALRFLYGCSLSETASIMGRGVGAVKTLQYRAIRRLATLLPPGLSDPG